MCGERCGERWVRGFFPDRFRGWCDKSLDDRFGVVRGVVRVGMRGVMRSEVRGVLRGVVRGVVRGVCACLLFVHWPRQRDGSRPPPHGFW